jgi:Flp pilus assembly pilin Flp
MKLSMTAGIGIINRLAACSRWKRAQTMTEYALILAAVAIVAYATYQVMGQDIGLMINTIDSALTTA